MTYCNPGRFREKEKHDVPTIQHEAAKIRAQLGGGLIAELSVLLERLGHDCLDVAAKPRIGQAEP